MPYRYRKGGAVQYEADIPSKEETEKQGSRFQSENEHSKRQKGFICKKS